MYTYKIKKLFNQQMFLENGDRVIDSVAFFSLKKALVSYFSTYSGVSQHADSIFSQSTKELEKNLTNYIENYYDTIIHFQHFFELILNDILRKEGKLELTDNKKIGKALHEIAKLKNKEYEVFTKYPNKSVIRDLNNLRNEIMHRGNVITSYRKLDELIGSYILPIVDKIVNLPGYKDLKKTWKWEHKMLDSGIDPIKEIIEACSTDNFSLDKVAFLKEMGRAAYCNPNTHDFGRPHPDISRRAERIAHSEVGEANVMRCPVCGINSLAKYIDVNFFDDKDPERYIENVKCYSCSLEIYNRGIKNPKEYGYDIPEFWLIKENSY